MKTRYRLLSPPEKGKHSPQGDVLVVDAASVAQHSFKELVFAWTAGLTSYLPWIALSAVLTLAAIVILNSGMSISDITHLMVPTAHAIGGLAV